MRSKSFRISGLLLILVFSALACQSLSRVGERVGSARQTVELAATKINEGGSLLGTARAIGTQMEGQGLVRTVEAAATQVGESGLVETVFAFATDQGPSLLSTAMAVATQQGPAAVDTVQAYVTQIAQSTPSPDIPVIEGEKEMFFQSGSLVSYLTATPYAQVLDFYKTQMLQAGWTKVDQDGFESASAANLNYEKGNRKASITLSPAARNDRTVVLIVIEQK